VNIFFNFHFKFFNLCRSIYNICCS